MVTMSSSAGHTENLRLARVDMLKLKIKEAGKVRMANFGFPQPPYDRFYSWITGMLVMLMELEQQDSLSTWQRLHTYVKICSEGGKGPLAALQAASESSYFSQSGKWLSLCGKFEMMVDVMTPLMKSAPERVNHMIQMFETRENWPEGFANGLGDSIMFNFDVQQPFLVYAMRVIMDELRAKGLYGSAVEELKIVTVPDFKPEWVPRMGLTGHQIRIHTGANRREVSVCSVCAQPASVPFHHCNYCGDSPSFHHGRCCPVLHLQSQNSDEDDTWGNMTAVSARPSNTRRGSASRSPARAG
jgi:hypothetical protein